MSGMTSRPRLLVSFVVASALALMILANAHLVYVAFVSQPECVRHLKDASGQPGTYRAANSSC
jgi:hypothetical protein